MMMNLLISPYNDPYLNLAMENQLLESLTPENEFLLLYINDPSVVIGRFQNPWMECTHSNRKDTYLVRRQSGGGTVYHDQGNLNFSFICPLESYDRQKNLDIICQIMKECSIDLNINLRHDLTVDYKGKTYKVSGSAFRHKKDRAFHHGTLLISSETDRLEESITPGNHKVILHASGTGSTRSDVINLSQVHPGLKMSQVIAAFENWFKPQENSVILNWSEDEWLHFSESPLVQAERNTLLSEDWILGKTPTFTQDIGALHLPETKDWQIRISKGIIEKAPKELSFLEGIQYGRRHTADEIRLRMKKKKLFKMTEDEFYGRLIHIIG
ncbi:hypothetical protein [Oceanispirochaeta sp.]|jgi:lipoate-protein ligase A|uniref:lipoyl protein ligase domain-containing protein n=1 Tax=Oceanispirochaeta sp. TaxID=2035350 RepID=UPI00260CE67E|nr:hypothetical protein [Oceanispirochaeta sp.]